MENIVLNFRLIPTYINIFVNIHDFDEFLSLFELQTLIKKLFLCILIIFESL